MQTNLLYHFPKKLSKSLEHCCLAPTLDAGGGVEGHIVRQALAQAIFAQDAPAHLVGAVFVVVAARAQLVAAARAKYGRRNQPHLH